MHFGKIHLRAECFKELVVNIFLSLYTLLRMLSKGFLLVLCQVNDVVQCQSLAVKEFFVVPFVEHAIKVVFTQITKKVCSYFRFLRLRLWWCIVHC